MSSKKIACCFKKAKFVFFSLENSPESVEHLGENKLKLLEKINEVEYVSTENAGYITEVYLSVDFFIQLYL